MISLNGIGRKQKGQPDRFMRNLSKQEFLNILSRHERGKTSPEEEAFLNAYFNAFELEPDDLEGLGPEFQEDIRKRLEAKIDNQISLPELGRPSLFKSTRGLISIAASFILIAGAIAFYSSQEKMDRRRVAVVSNKVTILPGGNKATLTLANGEVISLTDADSGAVASRGGIRITKTQDGEVQYEVIADNAVAIATGFNTIKTPRGGQYTIKLPDGTKAILNAASSLKFPTSFTGQDHRDVELTGEAYFEVAHNSQQPFRVMSAKQSIQVLGTKFNVNAYVDEPATVTTLVEGSVKVFKGSQSKTIKPGQATVVAETILTRPSDESNIAWRAGIISFNGASLETIMRQVSRWYDVDVSYAGRIPRRLFSGEISRTANLSELIEILESSNIKFKFNQRHITILP